MKCHEVLDKLMDFTDEELATDEAALIEQHLAKCNACREELAALNEAEGLLGSLAILENAPEITRHWMLSPKKGHRSRYLWQTAGVMMIGFIVLLLLHPWSKSSIDNSSENRLSQQLATTPEGIVSLGTQEDNIAPIAKPEISQASAKVAVQDKSYNLAATAEAIPDKTQLVAEPEKIVLEPEPPDGIILILGEPEEPESFDYAMQTTLPDGTQRITSSEIKRDAEGRPVEIVLVSKEIAPSENERVNGG